MLMKWLQAMMIATFLFSGAVFSAEKININTASVEQLQTLSGVGEVTAKAIVQYRKENGRFVRIDDLMKVRGIGSKKFEQLADEITVGKDK